MVAKSKIKCPVCGQINCEDCDASDFYDEGR